MKASLVILGIGLMFSADKLYKDYWCCFAIDDESRENTKSEEENSLEPPASDTPRSNWTILEFDFSNTEINSIDFETYSELVPIAATFSPVDRVEATKTVSNDRGLLKIAKFSFSDRNCLRNVVQSGVRGGEGNAYLIGKLTFDTTNGRFTIGVGSTGFSIDGNVPGCNTEFYSPAGAELLNMLYCKKTGIPLRENVVAALNGLRFIEHRRSVFRRLEWTKLVDGQ